MNARIGFSGAALLFAALVIPTARAQSAVSGATSESVPHLVQFSGVLKDAAARPVTGVASVTFGIYAEQEGGAALWSETQNVLADTNGHYSIVLGAATTGGFPVELFGTGQSRWLGVAIARHEESPRALLASVPYALKAGDAETLGGLPASAYVTTEQLAASNARPATTFVNGGESTIVAAPATTNAAGAEAGTSTDSAQSVIQANPTGSGTTDYIPLWTSGSNLGNSILFESGSKIGIGTTTPASTLDINGGEILRGGFYEFAQGTATASTGQPSHSFQWDASVFNSSMSAAGNYAFGFRAMPQNNNTANPAASLDLFYGTGGPTGSLADTGLSINSKGVITFVPSQTFNGSVVSASTFSFPYASSGNPDMLSIGGAPILSTAGSLTNIFLGYEAAGGGNITSGATSDVAIGDSALVFVTSGSSNTAVGTQAMQSTTSGGDNTALGTAALFNTTTTGSNTAVGYKAGFDNTGYSNTYVGEGSDGTSGSYDTALGATATVANGVSYSTAIGYGAIVTQTDSLVLGAPATLVGIGTSAPIATLDVSAPGGGSYVAPNPIAALNAIEGGIPALDFNTSAISTTGNYNPSVRIAVIDESSEGVGNVIAFYANKVGGGLNNGLQQTFAVDAKGNAYVTGTLSKAGGSFKIDDPIDPAGKYLSHSFVESPDMMNIYNGIVTLDAHGVAVVEMPEWFSALNRDFRYTLTAIGSPAPKLYIAEELHENRFRIAGGKKGQRVSWQITGIRQDAWANAHRIPTEEVKPASEHGHYLHPELFGASAAKAVSAAAVVTSSDAAGH